MADFILSLNLRIMSLVGLALSLILVFYIAGCSTGLPEGMPAVDNFELDKYLGKWYEIARLDHSFERGLSNVTANYKMRDDGRVDVLNRGYHDQKEKWQSANGIARLMGPEGKGSLKVSFFRPFWGDYHIVVLDEQYQYAMVTSSSKKYLWILARNPELDEDIKNDLVSQANQWGFATDELIYPKHDKAIIE